MDKYDPENLMDDDSRRLLIAEVGNEWKWLKQFERMELILKSEWFKQIDGSGISMQLAWALAWHEQIYFLPAWLLEEVGAELVMIKEGRDDELPF